MFNFANTTFGRATLGIVGTAVAAGLCLGAAAGPAQAQTIAIDAPRSAKVTYGDLNLANAAHQKQLDARLHAAARRVCEVGGKTVRERSDENRCIQTALKAAEPQRLAARLSPLG